ncbi:iron complex transport system substrate-binding protein [Natranaerovirga hydrolytica]|uniref:Iron complex transport system substrate-binding protein n=1 Tax=Natranaerovirga hydrolytica TaxID=680378 RepID=A0A4R1MTM7_9FIRM|nr:ABC transporter substrate-binding protein [Natranaerovirga hydrolytica]TCK93323.1 iron complex transport system substrate-binding protein [Natranaerovirga hydrolytica]
MSKKSSLSYVLMFLLTLVLMVGCGSTNKQPTDVEVDHENVTSDSHQDNEEEEEIVLEDTVKMVTDHLDREVEITGEPERVIALTRAYIEELFELGVTPVAKVEEYNNRPEGVELPSVSNQSKPDIEAIYALEPDLIIANSRQHSDILDLLVESGAPVFFVNPNIVEEDPLTDRIKLFGELLGKEDVAEEYITHLNTVSDELKETVAGYGYETGLMIQGGVESIEVAMPTGLYGALLMRLGIENIIPANLPGAGQSTWVSYDFETILSEDPDVIIVRAAGGGGTSADELLAYYKENPMWQDLTAIKEDKIFVLPARVNPGNISNEDALKVTVQSITPNE